MNDVQKNMSVFFLLLFCLGAVPFSEAKLRKNYRINDAGQPRSYIVADDELVYRDSDRAKFKKVDRKGSADDIRNEASLQSKNSGKKHNLVLYDEGYPREDEYRRVLTGDLLVRLGPGADIKAITKAVKAKSGKLVPYAPGYAIISVDGAGAALEILDTLRAAAGVVDADPLLGRPRSKRMIPTDPYFRDQWHLLNTGQNNSKPGIDINVTNVWNTYRGSGIVVGVIDDGVQLNHPDLIPNLYTAIDYDWVDATPTDPSPDLASDYHGTSVAGIIAAKNNNGRGVCGVSPESSIVGLRLLGAAQTDADEAGSIMHEPVNIHVKNNSWGPSDAGYIVEGPGPLTAAAFNTAATTGRGNKGTILVWAAGNGFANADNANYDGYANSRFTIAVGSVTDLGKQSYYSEPGACLVVTAPSDGGICGQITTDLIGNDGYNESSISGEYPDVNYTKTFGGTSGATPVISGVVALMLQANSNLGWRDVQAILMKTSAIVDPEDYDWARNSAGNVFNHKYGAGLVDADAAVSEALTWSNLGPSYDTSVTIATPTVIPDDNLTGVTFNMDLTGTNLITEYVELTVNATHPYRGDLDIRLYSPSGFESRMATSRHLDNGGGYTNWTFMSVRHWGENSQGRWKVKVVDAASPDVGMVNSMTLRVHGQSGGMLVGQVPPVIAAPYVVPVRVGETSVVTVVATDINLADSLALASYDLPSWASFEATPTTGGEITGTLTCRPTTVGLYPIETLAYDGSGSVSCWHYIYAYDDRKTILEEHFDATTMPAGWTVTKEGLSTVQWEFDDPGGRAGEIPHGRGNFACADSDFAGSVVMDTQLITPLLDLTDYDTVRLDFNTYFRMYSGNEYAEVLVRVNSGAWQSLWKKNRSFFGPAWVDATAFAAGQNNVQFSFHYYDANYDYYWAIDDVVLSGDEDPDLDSDGLPNWWERVHYGNATVADPSSDGDCDGMTAIKEYTSATDPTNNISFLRFIADPSSSESGVVLTWATEAGMYYDVQRSSNDLSNFQTIVSNRFATPPYTQFLDTDGKSGPPMFYRIISHPYGSPE